MSDEQDQKRMIESCYGGDVARYNRDVLRAQRDTDREINCRQLEAAGGPHVNYNGLG